MTKRMNCERVEVLLTARLDGTLEQNDRHEMDAHMARCADCRSLVSDIEHIVADARVLPVLRPTRDLWSGIAAQLGEQEPASVAGVVGVHTPTAHPEKRHTQPPRSWRTMAAAAVLLVAVTAAVTWNLAKPDAARASAQQVAASNPRSPVTDSRPARSTDDGRSSAVTPAAPPNVAGRATQPPPAAFVNLAEAERAELSARYAANASADVDAMYEREIRALRTIVDERFTELDSVTVSELRRNIDIIDKAIADSRSALQRDPRSRLLTKQLDRALEHKLDLLRRVALL